MSSIKERKTQLNNTFIEYLKIQKENGYSGEELSQHAKIYFENNLLQQYNEIITDCENIGHEFKTIISGDGVVIAGNKNNITFCENCGKYIEL